MPPHISPQLRHQAQQQQHQQQQNFTFAQQQPSLQQQMHDIATSLPQSLSPPLTSGPGGPVPYAITNTLPYNNFASTIQSTYPDFGFSDLDFLDSFPVQGANVNATGDTNVGGLADLGFGMGFDGNHDWSDGNGFDLFDGFFFGPAGSGGL